MKHIEKINKLAKLNSDALLRWYYRSEEQVEGDELTLDNLKNYCLEYGSDSINIKRMALRLNMLDVKRDAVKAVIKELSPDIQKLLYLHYNKNMAVTYIGPKVNMSEASVVDIRNSVQIKVCNFIRYRLTADDVFYRRKVINMIEMLARLITLADELDANNDFTNSQWRRLINNRYNNYRKILSMLDEKISQHELNMESYIVWQKVKHPAATNIELVSIYCKPYSTASVSRTLSSFKRSISKYLP